ncbi:MAG: I78 family peptidase inhibitor [Comamonas sp.]|uniref:I78 family peptidase inhibitor n=1 Tax=Comamonas sp. lk TaxID=2201272 RepID=UPI000EAFAEBE|nr:I78 family peptidase inhibitor [Comamonas sp. lk]
MPAANLPFSRLSLGTIGTLSLALLLSACAGTGGPVGNTAATPAPRPTQICNAQAVQSFIGHNTAASTLETARKKSGSYMVRVLRENQPATMEYNQERLNVITNEAGKIIALRCG